MNDKRHLNCVPGKKENSPTHTLLAYDFVFFRCALKSDSAKDKEIERDSKGGESRGDVYARRGLSLNVDRERRTVVSFVLRFEPVHRRVSHKPHTFSVLEGLSSNGDSFVRSFVQRGTSSVACAALTRR